MKCKSYEVFFMNFANRTKLDIVLALRTEPLTVSQIVKKVGGEQSKVSHSLKKLAACNILKVKQKGRERIYSLNKETIIPILNMVQKHVEKNCKRKCGK